MNLGDSLLNDSAIALPRDPSASFDSLDIHAAALLEPDATAELARLGSRGFVTGAVRTWSDGQRIVEVALQRFAASRDARLALEETRHALLAAAGEERVDRGGELDDRQTVTVIRVREIVGGFVADVAIGCAGRVTVSVLLGGSNVDERRAASLLRMQLARLS